jgi:O-antigen/teichoic acid export membrane protein
MTTRGGTAARPDSRGSKGEDPVATSATDPCTLSPAEGNAGSRRSPLARAVASSTVAQLFAHVVTLMTTMVISALLSRHLGPAGFGQYAVVFAYVNLLAAVLADLGLSQIAARDASQTPDEMEEILASAGVLQSAASVVAYLALVVVAYGAMGDWQGNGISIAGLVILFFPIDVLAIVLQIQLKLTRLAWIGVATAAVRLLLIWAAIAADAGITMLIVLTTAGSMTRYVLLPVILRQSLRWRAVRPRRRRYRRLLVETLPVALATACLAVMAQAPILLLDRVSSSEQVGYFSAAVRITANVSVPAIMLMTTLYPVFARLANEDPRAFARLGGQVLRGVLLVAMPVAVSGLLVGSWLIGLIYGEPFAPAGPVFAILMGQAGIVFPSTIVAHLLIALGQQRTDLLAVGAGAVIVVAAGIALGPAFGAVGGAAGLLIGSLAACIWMFGSIYRRFGASLELRGRGLVGAGLALVVAIAVASMVLPVPLATCLGLVVYALALIAFGGVDRGDAEALRMLVLARGRPG